MALTLVSTPKPTSIAQIYRRQTTGLYVYGGKRVANRKLVKVSGTK